MTFSDFKWGQARCLVGESRVKLFDNLEESDCQWEHQILLSDIWQCGKYISGLSKQTESAMSTRPAVRWKAVRDEWIASCVDSHLDPDSMRYCVIEVFVKLEYWRSWLIAGQDIFLPPPPFSQKEEIIPVLLAENVYYGKPFNSPPIQNPRTFKMTVLWQYLVKNCLVGYGPSDSAHPKHHLASVCCLGVAPFLF